MHGRSTKQRRAAVRRRAWCADWRAEWRPFADAWNHMVRRLNRNARRNIRMGDEIVDMYLETFPSKRAQA